MRPANDGKAGKAKGGGFCACGRSGAQSRALACSPSCVSKKISRREHLATMRFLCFGPVKQPVTACDTLVGFCAVTT